MEADNYLHLFSFDVDIVKHDHLSKRLQSVGRICRIYSLFRILASYIVIFSKFGNVRITNPREHCQTAIAEYQNIIMINISSFHSLRQ